MAQDFSPTPAKPTVGRIVHYRLPEGPNAGEVRPAIIVRVWNDGLVQLVVFLDGSNDGLSEIATWKASVKQGFENGEWMWPLVSTSLPTAPVDRAQSDTVNSLPVNTTEMQPENNEVEVAAGNAAPVDVVTPDTAPADVAASAAEPTEEAASEQASAEAAA